MIHVKKFLLALAASLFAQSGLAAGDHGNMKMNGHDTHGQGGAMQHGTHRMSGGQASAAGEPGNAAQAARTIDVVMSEFRFEPAPIEVKAGETVRFRVRNAGRIQHEMVIGAAEELKTHAKAMREQAGMVHQDPNALTLDPGQAAELIWRFTGPGTFEYACLLPGHYEAGMTAKVVVR